MVAPLVLGLATALFEDAVTICNLGGFAGQPLGNGWDSMPELRAAGCIYLTMTGTQRQLPEVIVGENKIPTGCADVPFVRASFAFSFPYVVYDPQPASPDTRFQHALVALHDWAGPADNAVLWQKESTGGPLPGTVCVGDICNNTACYDGFSAVSADFATASELKVARYTRPASWVALSSFRGVNGGCLVSADCNDAELACRQGPLTLPGVCYRASLLTDTDVDVSSNVAAVVLSAVTLFAIGYILYHVKKHK